jgi:hypothetical protein
MSAALVPLLAALRATFRSRLELDAEILALRHQLAVLQRQAPPNRRRIVHVNVTARPTAAWTAQQLREAWPCDTAPRFLLRDRDAIYGSDLRRTAQAMGLEQVLTAPRAPWQNPFVERLIGSLRRECLDHVIVWNERSLRRCLQQYVAYYHAFRTHLSLDKDAPVPRPVHTPAAGTIVQVPHVGGLHHHYQRHAA